MSFKSQRAISLWLMHFALCFCLRHSSVGSLYFRKDSFSVFKSNQSFQSIPVYDDFQCLLICKRSPECLSLNIGVQPNKDGSNECVLLRNQTRESTELTPSHLHHHYTRLVDNCTSCVNNGSCESLLNDFRCHCPQGFMGKRCEKRNKWWLKMNNSPVCFGAKDSSFGRFYIKQNGTVTTIKLVHQSGYVTCNYKHHSARSNWGCGAYSSKKNKSFPERMFTVITDDQDQKILPQDEFINNFDTLEYGLPGGVTSQSPELVFPNFSPPMNVTAGQEYHIWYGQDLKDIFEDKNYGNACVDVYIYGWFG